MSSLPHRIPTRLLSASAIVVLASSALIMTTALPASAADRNGCSANVQNPHFSNSHGGIDVTAKWKCSDVTTTIYLAANRFVGGVGFWLWLCPNKPPKSESYLNNSANGCHVKGVNHEDISLTTSGKTISRTSPPLSHAAAHGSGWWIACSIWASNGPGGLSAKHTTFGNAVELSG